MDPKDPPESLRYDKPEYWIDPDIWETQIREALEAVGDPDEQGNTFFFANDILHAIEDIRKYRDAMAQVQADYTQVALDRDLYLLAIEDQKKELAALQAAAERVCGTWHGFNYGHIDTDKWLDSLNALKAALAGEKKEE